MWFDRALERLGYAPRVDLSRRADPANLPELMDAPGSYEQLRSCLRDLARVNRLTRSYAPTLQFFKRVLAAHPGLGPMEVLDVGAGYGDMLRTLRRWSRRHAPELRLTGIDLQPFAARAAAEADGEAGVPAGAIRWVTGNAFAQPEPPDVIISSLVMHHLRDAEIIEFLAWMERDARLGWFINDLERAEQPYRWFGVLARLLRWHPFVQHDGPVSFRRAFREADWERLLAAAAVTGARIRRVAPARLCVERIRQRPEPA